MPMDLARLITPADTLVDLRVTGKNEALRELCRRAGGRVDLDGQFIHELIAAREGLGSTGMGHGIALPHATIPGLTQFFGILARLHRPIDFASVDSQPVDLIFLLLSPPSATAKEHLGALAAISRRLRETSVLARLRNAHDATAAYEAFSSRTAPRAAAGAPAVTE